MGREEAEERKLGMACRGEGRAGTGPRERGTGPSGSGGVDLSEIVDARIEEMLLLVDRRLGERHLADRFGAGVSLAGAGARVAGLEEKARRILGLPARVSRPRLAGIQGVDLTAPENALGTGLLRWSFDGAPQVETRQARWGTGWLASAVRWLAAGF
jgi:hypothetical protein